MSAISYCLPAGALHALWQIADNPRVTLKIRGCGPHAIIEWYEAEEYGCYVCAVPLPDAQAAYIECQCELEAIRKGTSRA